MSKLIQFRHAYSESVRDSDIECKEPSLAQQQFKDDADINVLLERFKVTGVMPQGLRVPTFGDFTGVQDYRSAMEAVRAANNAFMDLPANIRSRFNNDPQQYMEFFNDPKNKDEAAKLGLLVPGINPLKGDAEPSDVLDVRPNKDS